MTIHVTPEPEFSYVSFETNVPLSSYGELIRRVAETFQPGKFIVTLLANKVTIILDYSFRTGELQIQKNSPKSSSTSK